MRVVVLADNRKLDENLEAEHGLCVYLETGQYRCLLDTGASDIFIHNAEKLGIDLTSVDYVFISHGHADHIGGLPAFLEINSKAKVILLKYALTQRYFSKRIGFREISIALDVRKYPDRFIFVEQETVLDTDIWVRSCHKHKYPLPKGNRTLFKNMGFNLKKDDFNHELVVCFGKEEVVAYVGCSHKGLLNILNEISKKGTAPQTVIGGFHLLDSMNEIAYESDEELDELAQNLQAHYPKANFITGHCTGDYAFNRLKTTLGSKLIQFYTGFNQTWNTTTD